MHFSAPTSLMSNNSFLISLICSLIIYRIKMTNDGNLPTSATSERMVSSFYPSPAVSNSAMSPPQTKKRSESWNYFISVRHRKESCMPLLGVEKYGMKWN
jgi:hypothetical protein